MYAKEITTPDIFCEEIKRMCLRWAREVLEMPSHYPREHSYLKRRDLKHNVINSTPWSEWDKIVDLVGSEEAREIKRRQLKMLRKYGEVDRIVIQQYDLPEEICKLIQDEVFEFWGIPHSETMPILQIQHGGELLHPHKGHARKASMFCLLLGEGEVTKWYDSKEDLTIPKSFHIPDMDKLTVVEEHVLREDKWTLFNHEAWHSVHRNSTVGTRINIGVDFKTMDINECMEYFND